jgi:enamine deaminase RidA (YjgF/YER057c/UK114 family)
LLIKGDEVMLERYYVTPKNTYTVGGNSKVIYTPVVVLKTSEVAQIYVSGRAARLENGDVAGKGDMRAQIRLVCENLQIALASVGASLADVTRTVTYTTDMPAYFSAIDERWKYFKEPLPTSTLIGVARLAIPEMLIEIEAEAAIEPGRLQIPK